MQHPSHEELVDFLDDELELQLRAEIARHIEECGECSDRIAAWRCVRSELQSWTLRDRPAAAAGARSVAAWPKWARIAAALLLVATGFSVARMTAPVPDLQEIQSNLARELRSELQSELNSFATAQLADQQEYQQAMIDSVLQLDARWAAEFGVLRQDIETVAVRTQAEFAKLGSTPP